MKTEITRLQRISLNCQCLLLACLHRKWKLAAQQIQGIQRASLSH